MEDVKIINMTQHPINILDESGKCIKIIPTSGGLIRLTSKTADVGKLDGIRITKVIYEDPIIFGLSGEVYKGLLKRQVGVYYIVSQLVKAAFSGREDLLVPNEVVRNQDGAIIGCRSLGQ